MPTSIEPSSPPPGRRHGWPLGLAFLVIACPGPSKPPDNPTSMQEFFFSGDPRVCSVDRWCWENPMPQGNDLLAIWARGPRQICAVGRDGTALHYSGNAWRREPTSVHRDLHGVWAPPLRSCGREGPPASEVKPRGGAKQTPCSEPNGGREEFLAVGARGTLLHFRDGRWQWRDAGTSEDLYAILGRGRRSFFVVGAKGTLRHCGDAGCRPMKVPTGATLRALAMESDGDALWIGGDGVVLRRAKAGPTTLVATLKTTINALRPRDKGGVWAAGGDGSLRRCTAKGCAVALRGAHQEPLVGLTSGAAGLPRGLAVGERHSRILQLQRSSASGGAPSWALLQRLTPLRLRALAGSAEGLFAVGDGAALVRQQKGIWQQEMPTGANLELFAVAGGGLSEIYAVGARGLVLHHDGRSWQRLSSSTTARLQAVAPVPGGALVAGSGGTLLSCNRKRCVPRPFPYRASLHGLASRSGQIWAVGDGGLFAHFALLRGKWRAQRVGNLPLRAVLASERNGAIWIAGDGGALARWAKGKLKTIATGSKRALLALAEDRQGAILVGGDGLLLRCREAGCSDISPRRQQVMPRAARGATTSRPGDRGDHAQPAARRHARQGPLRLRGVWVGPEGTIHAVGPERRVLLHDGRRWRQQRSGFAGALNAIWGSAKGHLFVVGEGGAILQQVPEGSLPKTPNTPAGPPLSAAP